MDPKTQQRAMKLCALIESELRTLSASSDARPPELAKAVGRLDELRTLIEALDRAPVGKVSHVGSAVWRVVAQVSLELIKALADSQKYMQQPVQETKIKGHGTANAWYDSQETPWSERTVAERACSAARSRSKLCLTSRKRPSRTFCASSPPTSNASRYPTRPPACHYSLVRYA